MFLLEYIFIVLIINVWIINRLFTVVIEILNQRSIRVKNKKRLAWIDIAKGLGMICVVMGHSFLLNAQALYMKAIIYGFHMPLFFIISGYLINDSMNRGKIIKKRVQSLLIPYVTYSIIIRLFNIVLDYIRGIKHNMFNDVVGSIVQIRGTNYSGVVWFLTWMFVSQLIMLIILKIATTEIWRNIICIILFLIGSIITNVLRYKLPWHVDAAFISVLFLRFGMIYKNKQKIVDKYITSSGAKNKDDIQALDPGKYEIASTFGKGGTKPLLRGKPKDIKAFNVPGPGDYESGKAKIKTLRRSPTTCLGFGNRPDITEIEIKKNVPGFKYEIKSEFDVSDVNKIKANKFGKSERMKNIINNTPGPGSYHIPCSFAVLPDYEKVTESKFRKI